MDRLLARLERRIGNLAIPRLPYVIAVTSAVVFALNMMRPGFMLQLMLFPQLVAAGQVWRLITWIFIPPTTSLLWTVFMILFYASIGTALEHEWGSFKLNVYYLIGIVGTIIGSFAFGVPMSAEYLHATIFFAFATLFPDHQFLLFFIVPVRAKWLALLTVAALAFGAWKGSTPDRIAMGLALANYFLFFTPTLIELARGAGRVAAAERRRAAMRDDDREARPVRKCKICGLTDDDEGADLRVCTCQEVCGGKPTVYCLPHARSHNAKS